MASASKQMGSAEAGCVAMWLRSRGLDSLLMQSATARGSPRSATVRAISIVVPIDERRFLFMVQQTPFFALRLMRVMTARLRAMNERAKAAE
jgi:CRP/FNR family cyclic AMP-dependent transcriptional regulator